MNNSNRRIVLYVDGSGSQKTASKGNPLPIGWGVVALHDDTHHEIVKGEYPRTEGEGALFEPYAFIEGVQYAIAQGFAPEQISIHTDDERLVRAVFQLHPENYRAGERAAFIERLKWACRRFGSDAYDNVLQCLARSMVSKIDRSEFTLYHYRAHYLANAGRLGVAVLEGELPPTFLSYDEWIASVVFKFYMSSQVATQHGILGPFHPKRATKNGAVQWDFIPPFSRMS